MPRRSLNFTFLSVRFLISPTAAKGTVPTTIPPDSGNSLCISERPLSGWLRML